MVDDIISILDKFESNNYVYLPEHNLKSHFDTYEFLHISFFDKKRNSNFRLWVQTSENHIIISTHYEKSITNKILINRLAELFCSFLIGQFKTLPSYRLRLVTDDLMIKTKLKPLPKSLTIRSFLIHHLEMNLKDQLFGVFMLFVSFVVIYVSFFSPHVTNKNIYSVVFAQTYHFITINFFIFYFKSFRMAIIDYTFFKNMFKKPV